MGKVEIIVELGGGPDRARLDAAVGQVQGFLELRLAALREGQLQIGQQPGLVALDGEQVVGLTFLDEVGGERALGQQRVGSEGFTGEVDGLDERDEGSDLVGLFGLFVSGGQSADFFWAWAVPL